MKRIVTVLLFLSTLSLFAQRSLDRKWYVPDHAKAQFAGSMGMASAGVGYSLFRNRADLDVYAGFLPERYSSDELFIFTLKYTQLVVKPVAVNYRISFTPLTAGIYVTYSKGEKFTTKLPNHYPMGYYWWSETIRPNIFIGGNVAYKTKADKSISVYYELGTNELKAVSYALNTEYLSPWDILHLGLGIKFAF